MSGAERPAQIAVEADSVGKCYRIFPSPRARLLQGLWGERRQLYREFWALQNVSFQLPRGQTLGVVGRNGSGKSTLLQLLCNTLTPTTGQIRVHGRIGALLELGSGFNPEFSGRENVILNGSVLGLSEQQIEAKLDAILAFADIGNFIDQPVKTYSSGMVVRLAFAVQAHIDPDILVVDEALAVGDEMFQKKCYAHLERLKERGTSILLVTHSCPQIIQHCDQALLLHKGIARMLSEPARVTVTYQRLINASDAEWDAVLPNPPTAYDEQEGCEATAIPSDSENSAKAAGPEQIDRENWNDPELKPETTEIYPSHGARIVEAWIECASGDRANVLDAEEEFNIVFRYLADQDLSGLSFTCHLASTTGQRISGQTLTPEPDEAVAAPTFTTGSQWEVRFHFHAGLWPGVYFIGGGILSPGDAPRHMIHRVIDYRAMRVVSRSPQPTIGACNLRRCQPSLQILDATSSASTPT
jgi:lipopolysaccharide transport system ATP-binding protein